MMKSRKPQDISPVSSVLLVSQNLLNGRPLPKGAILANPKELQHINTYGSLPEFYQDYPFVCRDCGSKEIWTAEQQQWWYEVAKAHIDSFAVRCRKYRQRRKGAATSEGKNKNEPNKAL